MLRSIDEDDYDYQQEQSAARLRELHETNEESLRDTDPWYRRATDILDQVPFSRGAWLRQLTDAIALECARRFDAALDETADAMADAEAYAKDIYAYHGVSRRDFL